MALWNVEKTPEGIALSYTGKSGVVQECGKCDPATESKLVEWLFSPGQADPCDRISLHGREFALIRTPHTVRC